MCRNICPLHNFEPPATEQEVRAAALRFVHKLSGCNAPARINEAVFDRAVDEISAVATRLIASRVTMSPPRNHEVERSKSALLSAQRFGAR
jgi:hypothetical protein